MKILLCCGAGMSSGFMAQQVRAAAKKQGFTVKCDAKAQSVIENIVKDYDVLCLGPHLGAQKKSFEKMCEPFLVPVIVIPSDIYGRLDGKRLYELCIETIKNHSGDLSKGQ